jgi:hypothetical protein
MSRTRVPIAVIVCLAFLAGASFAAPAAPTPSDRVSATAGDGTAVVFFKPPASTGGSPVIAYRVTASTSATAAGTGPIATSGPVTPGPV